MHQQVSQPFLINFRIWVNNYSIGIGYEGGLDEHGRCKDTRTLAQKVTMEELLQSLCVDYPDAEILGHRDLPGVHKE